MAEIIKKEYEENPQQTLIKLFFFPLSPLFFPVPVLVLYTVSPPFVAVLTVFCSLSIRGCKTWS